MCLLACVCACARGKRGAKGKQPRVAAAAVAAAAAMPTEWRYRGDEHQEDERSADKGSEGVKV